jgi:uncharacterized DUF497 family protein
MIVFAWDDWNVDHISEHGVTLAEAEFVVRRARPSFPREIGDDKYQVWGPAESGRLLQVVFVFRADDEVDYESLTLDDVLALADNHATTIYVIHAMEMTDGMKRQYRKL